MIRITKIHGIWSVVNDEENDIIECFDTKAEALKFYEPYRIQKALTVFDATRSWHSLWDEEHKKLQA